MMELEYDMCIEDLNLQLGQVAQVQKHGMGLWVIQYNSSKMKCIVALKT